MGLVGHVLIDPSDSPKLGGPARLAGLSPDPLTPDRGICCVNAKTLEID